MSLVNHRPIVLARKPGPLRPLNIEETRIGTSKDVPFGRPSESRPGQRDDWRMSEPATDSDGRDPNLGRWPSNVLLQDAELFDEPNPYVVGSGATVSSGVGVVGSGSGKPDDSVFDFGTQGIIKSSYGDSGGYSRFFLIPNDDLLGHLTKLVTPPDGVVFDPFARNEDDGVNLIVGDCIEVMRAMEPETVDAVVTDPPYNLAFMGRQWDAHPTPSKFMEWCREWGAEALRVTKPGGYLLAFGGTRTHHRLVCGLEDAGWIIRDELDWIYASGFPKGKANLKPAHEPIVLARKPGPLRPLNIDATRIPMPPYSYPTGPKGNVDPTSIALPRIEKPVEGHPDGRWPSNLLLSDPELFDEPNPYVVGSGATSESGLTSTERATSKHGYEGGWQKRDGRLIGFGDSGGYSRFFIIPKADRADREPVLRGQLQKQRAATMQARLTDEWEGRSPTPSRENAHPTVKPVDLMRHLIRLVTPPGGTILDPFLGSGSTAIAAELEGFPWVGIEKEPEYVAIAEARLNGTQRGLGLDTPLVGEPRKSSVNPSGEFGRSDKPHWFGVRAGERSVYGYDGPPREKKPKPAEPPGMFDEEPAA